MRISLRTLLSAALAVAMLAALPAVAERTRFWRQSSYEEFEKGTAKGVALRSDGKLALAPRFAQYSDPNAAYLWALRADSKGTIYAAGGSNAKVMKFDASGEPIKVFESGELAAQALVIDAKDNLYIATSPDGKVYKVTPAGQQSVFFEPKTKYIWDLALAANGNLYVATGDKGEVFEVTPDGKGHLYYKSDEVHARALAFDTKGNLIVGTDPNGLILRLERPKPAKPGEVAGATQGFVLYEMAKKEVTSLLADRNGNLYAAAVGDKPRSTAAAATAAQQLIQQAAAQAAAAAAQTQPPGATAQPQPPPAVSFPQLATTGGGSDVYRIAPDGAPQQLWTSRDELVYSLGFSAAGKLLLGTGNRGRLIQLEGNGIYSSLAQTASSQITGVAQGPGRKVFVCTANPGKVFTLGPDYEAEGTFESQAFDAKVFSQWGRLNWWGENGATHGQVSFYVRSGNTSNPEKNWSAWAGPFTNARGEATAIPPARFVQWKALFKAPAITAGAEPAKSEPSDSISISWVNLAYLPKNVAPTVDNVVVQSPGVRVQGFTVASSGGPGNQPAQLKLPPAPGQPATSPAGPTQRFEPPPQGFVQRGFQSVLWGARDENDDELSYAIYYRGESEKNWKLLKDKLDSRFYTWDAGTMPDGAYYLKVVASDSASNPAGEALTAERESDRFEVDNTPPAAVNLRAEQSSPDVRVTFEARDSYSAISRVEYSLDAGEWMLVFPVDRATDSPQENFDLVLRGVAPGEHTLAVRVYDQFENSSSAKITFVVTAERKK